MSNRFADFSEFYRFYLQQHENRLNRRLHFVGTFLVILIVLCIISGLNPWWLVMLPIVGYGFAWVGHYFFEKNKPATFQHPFYSLVADFVLFRDILTGKIKF